MKKDMSEDSEKWVEEILTSMQGSKKAYPSSDLFVKIERRIDNKEGKVLFSSFNVTAIAATAILVLFNIIAIQQYKMKNESSANYSVMANHNYNESIISNYKIYE